MLLVGLLAYGSGLVGAVWFAIDASRIPPMVWFWSGYSRPGWWATVAVGFVAFGLPALVAAIAWRRSEARRTLLREVDELRAVASSRRERRERRGGTVV